MYRKLFIAIMMAALAINVYAQKNWTDYRRYEKVNVTDKQLPQEQRKVVFMGNSITDNWYSMRKDFFKSNGYIGRGISGQTSHQMLVRFHEDVVNLHPKAVVINSGTNDIAENNHDYVEDRTYENIIAMVEIAQANKIKVILTTITPCERYSWHPELKDVIEKIKHLNDRLRAYAKTHKCLFVDYWTALANEKGAMKDGLSNDGCHPTMEGYAIMEPLVKAAIQKVVK
jgi:lysophospholipase L1-like esterase